MTDRITKMREILNRYLDSGNAYERQLMLEILQSGAVGNVEVLLEEIDRLQAIVAQNEETENHK